MWDEQERQGGHELQRLLQEARLQQTEGQQRLEDAQEQLAIFKQEADQAAAELVQRQAELEELR